MTAQQLTYADPPAPTEPGQGTPEYWVLGLLRGAGPQQKLTWSRSELAYFASLDDRTIRRAIAELIRMGWPIVSTSHAVGYRLATTAEDLEPAIADAWARVTRSRERAEALERTRQALGMVAA